MVGSPLADAQALVTRLDAGLLMLRLGAGAALAMVFVWGGFPNATVAGITPHRWMVIAVVVLGVSTVVGYSTRLASALLAAAMAWGAIAGLRAGQDALQEPVRALMFVVLYATLALTGPGALAVERHAPRVQHQDLGLLVLRVGAGVSLLCCFGLTKIGWVVALARSSDPWSAWPFAQLIRAVGLPAPLALAFCAVLNETVTPLLVAIGRYTRLAAAIGALGMTGALYTSLRIGEEPVRAVLFVVAFATVALTGPGRFAVTRQAGPERTTSN